MSSINRKSFNSGHINDKNKTKSNISKKLNPKNITLQKKSCSSKNIKTSKDDINTNTNMNNYLSHISKNNANNNNKNSNTKKGNKPKNIQRKTVPKKTGKNNINNNISKNIKRFQKNGSIESYPSILSTDTLTIKNNNINSSKKNEAEHIFSFDFLNNQYKKDSLSYFNINKNNNIIIENNENKNNKNNLRHNIFGDLITAEKNEEQKFSKSEKNKININKNNRLIQNINQKDINKIQLNFKLNNNSTIHEIESSQNNSTRKEKAINKYFEPEFIKEIKQKNIIKIDKSISKRKHNSFSLSLNYSSNTTDNNYKNKYSYRKYNLFTDSSRNKITNYKTYYRNMDNNNYYILSQSSSTFKQINSRKSNRIPKILSNRGQLEEINEDDIDTVKQENTFGSKFESITSETYKDIQMPKNCVYFFEVPEEQNYNHIQGPIEFEYDNSFDQGTINSRNEDVVNDNNCSKLNNINIYKIERKLISNDDDCVNYYDKMKENDEDTISNINNNINNGFNSISSINDKTISNNGSFSNFNLKINTNDKLISEIKTITNKNNNSHKIDMENEKSNNKEKIVNSYKKKIIKSNFDTNKTKSSKVSTKINQNYSEEKKKKILLYRLKNYKIKVFVNIIQKNIIKHKRKVFNKFKNINIKTKQFIFLVEKVYNLKCKEFLNKLSKHNDKNVKRRFSLYTPCKKTFINNNNYNILIFDKDVHNQTSPVPNDYDSLNYSSNIYPDNIISSTIKNNSTQNNIFKKPILNFKSLGDKTDSFFYVKKLLSPTNTAPFTNFNNFDKNEFIRKKKKTNFKRNLIPKYKKNNDNFSVDNMDKINKNNNININNNNIITQSEKKDNIIIKSSYKSEDIVEDNEDEILEQAYKYKIIDEERCSNGNFHRNIKSELDTHKKIDLKTYFLKEVEKLEFPDGIDNNEPNDGQENVEETYSY